MRDVGDIPLLVTSGILRNFRADMEIKPDSNISVEGISQKVVHTRGVASRFIPRIRNTLCGDSCVLCQLQMLIKDTHWPSCEEFPFPSFYLPTAFLNGLVFHFPYFSLG